MNAVRKQNSRLMYLLTLALMAGLVGCTAAGYPTVPGTGNLAGGGSVGPVPGNPAGSAPLAGNPPVGNASVGGGDVISGGPGAGSLTPGVPYPMPQPQPNMPSGILGFLPPDGVQVCPTLRVALTVRLTDAMRKLGTLDPSKFTLTLDGKNILSEIGVSIAMIFPPTEVTLSYVQRTPLALGSHQVKFTYPSPTGPITLTWNFTVANIPCQ